MVTVIINTYKNDLKVLHRAVQSFRDQTYKPVQIIISTVEGDPVLDRLNGADSYKEYDGIDFSVLPLKDHPGKSPAGAYEQINHALKLIHPDSQWLCYASGNDYANPGKIAKEISMCLTHQREVCYSAFTKVAPDGSKLADVTFTQYDYQRHLKGNFVSDCSLISRRLVDKYLPYQQRFGNFAHWDSWLRMYEGEGNIFVYNHVPTWNYVQNAKDMSNTRKSDPEKLALYLQSQRDFIKTRLK